MTTSPGPDHDQRQHVIQACYDHDVKFIRLWFTDILGILKSVAITIEELEHALDDGVTFDGASIEGFARVDEADMVAVPDPSTFQLLPWRPRELAVARMVCDIRTPGGAAFEGDPRWVLRRTVARAAKQGLTFYVSPEIEFFYFRDATGTEPLDRGGYFDLTPLDSGTDLRRETVLTLESMGIGVALSHHEAAPSQHEIDLRYTDALTMADAIMTYRLVVKEVAMRHGAYATFMPKPLRDVNGSGMHLQLSLFRGEDNAFSDPDDALGLSSLARHFMAGLIEHAPETMLVTNQWVNSYRRIVPGFEAPTHATWSTTNHADLLGCRCTRRGTPARRASSTACRTRPATPTWRSPRCSPRASTASSALRRCHRHSTATCVTSTPTSWRSAPSRRCRAHSARRSRPSTTLRYCGKPSARTCVNRWWRTSATSGASTAPTSRSSNSSAISGCCSGPATALV